MSDISLWDPLSETIVAKSLLTKSPVSSIACHPTSQFTLAAATYSGVVQIWDVRSTKKPLFEVRRNRNEQEGQGERLTKSGKLRGERLMAVDWDGEVLVAGGEDGEVGVWRVSAA
jgi:ribosome biogenesis protein YTM1